jgi:membrane protease YdiL (CAAX protease family)
MENRRKMCRNEINTKNRKNLLADSLGRFYTDPIFIALALAPTPIWLLIYLQTGTIAELGAIPLLTLTFFYPVLEEIIFRGILQPWIAQRWKQSLFNLSVANLITSSIFALVHLFHHSLLWAMATFIPSLIFGYSRERYNRLLAPIVLHASYNGGYFLIGATLINQY